MRLYKHDRFTNTVIHHGQYLKSIEIEDVEVKRKHRNGEKVNELCLERGCRREKRTVIRKHDVEGLSGKLSQKQYFDLSVLEKRNTIDKGLWICNFDLFSHPLACIASAQRLCYRCHRFGIAHAWKT